MKFIYGEVFKLGFDDDEKKLYVVSINTINKRVKETEFSYRSLTFQFHIDYGGSIFGRKRILKVFEKTKKVYEIRIDRTAWCRLDKLDEMLAKFRSL